MRPSRRGQGLGRALLERVREDAAGEPVYVMSDVDPYYEGMALLRGGPVVVRGGTTVSSDELREGTEVDVWTAEACAESYPVQCGIDAIRITD